MKIKRLVGAGLLTMAMLSSQSLGAEDEVEDVLNSQTELVSVSGDGLAARWSHFIERQGWDSGEVSTGGVMYLPGRQLIVGSAVKYTRVDKGQPGWVESRLAAFERAELEAKVKIARFLSESPQTRRSLSLLEDASWSDGSIAEVEQLSEVERTLNRLGKKTLALTDASLDRMLRTLDPDYDPSEFEGRPREEIRTVLEARFNRRLRNMATRTIAGVIPVYSAEDEEGEQYGVLVGVVWSPKLHRLAMNLFNRHYRGPTMESGRPLREHVPTDTQTLLATMGPRIVVDENGYLSVLVFGQAQPRKTSPQREQSALQLAKQIAADRARAQLVNFVREGVSFQSDEISQELTREFSDYTVGTENVREIRRRIRGQEQRIRIRGVQVLGEWDAMHPYTGDRVAGAVIAWSPASAQTSREMGQTINNAEKQEKDKSRALEKQEDPLESMDIDTSTY